MTSLQDIDNYVNQLIHLYFELCRRVESSLQLGPYSGAKRSIMLLIHERGGVHARDLYREFDDPSAPSYAPGIITELAASGLLSLSGPASNPLMRLTPSGHAMVEQIREAEMAFAQKLSEHFSLDDFRKGAELMEKLRTASRTERLAGQLVQLLRKAS